MIKKLTFFITVSLFAQTQPDWNTQIRNKPNITRTGSNATWTDNVTMSGTETFSGVNTFSNTNTHNGTEIHNGTETHNGAESFGRLNLVRQAYVGSTFDTAGSCAGEMGCIINGAIKDIPDAAPEGIIIYAFGGGTINTNPFATIGNRSGIIYFGTQLWTINVQLQLPKAWKMEGYGRGGLADNKNTIIAAGASFPTSTPMIQMGINPVDNGVQVRNLGIDCHNVAGVSGIQNQFSQEQSLVEHVLIVNCPGGALAVSGQAQNSGPYTDLEVLNFSCSNCSASTVPISIGSVTSFRGIRGATINSNGATLPTIALRIDAAGTYSDIHIESAVSSAVIGSQVATNGAFLANIECGPLITNCVTISSAFSTQNISLFAITATTGNIVLDQILGNTLSAAGEGNVVSMYATGNGSPPSVVTSSVTTGSIFGAQIFFKERGAPSGSNNYDACYGDSGIHALKCSYNNGTFFQQTQTLVSSSSAMTTALIAAGACGATVTAGAANVAATDTITWAFNAAPAANPGVLVVSAWPTAGFVNFQYCNPTAAGVTPNAATLNWRVMR